MNERLLEKLRACFKEKEYQFRSEKELCKLAGMYKEYEKEELHFALRELVKQGEIVLDANKKYLSSARAGAMRGRIQGGDKGFAFFIPEDASLPHLFVPGKALHGAMDGDTVLARKSVKASASNDEGEVLTLLDRKLKTLTGVFEGVNNGKTGFVTPHAHPFFGDVYIPFGKTYGAKTGDTVVVHITEYPIRGQGAEGEITEIFTADNALLLEEESILREADLPLSFPEGVLKEADKNAKEDITPYLETRANFTDLYTFTIDGADTRDIDDAVSLETEGEYLALYVHIADVTHYVKQGSALDREAFARGTSVYFPDRVLPMLPPALSNGACSLNEGEYRLALTCKILFTAQGNPVKSELMESVIRSDRRLTYGAVNEWLMEGKSTGDKKTDETLTKMNALAKALSNSRYERGAVNLEVKESGIYYDNGVVTVCERKRADGEKLIEEFMIAANEGVARFAEKAEIPFVYRVHESPAPEKLFTFSTFASALGLRASFGAEVSPAEFRDLLDLAVGQPYFRVLNDVMLRSMQKARYQPENVGHFGLASETYCHFTSPIRRYPDLTVHRVLKTALRGGIAKARTLKEACLSASAQSNVRERIADETERDVDDLYKTYYMSGFIGKEMPAVISGVTSFGIFAETADSCEGLIRPEELPKDIYDYQENTFALLGKKHEFHLGDEIVIRVLRADLTARKVDFALVTEEETGGKIHKEFAPAFKEKKEEKRAKPKGNRLSLAKPTRYKKKKHKSKR